jgi:sterol desaturase/sphingolipid hydroxylase (fatty acid hydroxylase superfamily)
MMEWSEILTQVSDLVMEGLVQPLMFKLGLGGWVEDSYEASEWVLWGLFELVLMMGVLWPIQKIWPAESETAWAQEDRGRAIRCDVVYTLIQRLGVFRLFFFILFSAPVDQFMGYLHVQGWPTYHLEQWLPGIGNSPILTFMVYLVVLDFFNYWIHRAQHQWSFWWALHSVHHSQRVMTFWSDSRNHFLDDVMVALLGVVLAQFIGVPPSQFVLLVVLTQLSQSLQHANVRWSWGPLEWLWVSPRFHRYHHSMGAGHEFSPGVLGGHNFGVLLPWWDMLFGTANFDNRYDPTGIRPDNGVLENYGQGVIEQQYLGLKRLWKAVKTES